MLQGGPILQMRKWELWEVKQFAQVYTGSQLRDQDSNPNLLMLNPTFFPVYHVNSSIPVKHTSFTLHLLLSDILPNLEHLDAVTSGEVIAESGPFAAME